MLFKHTNYRLLAPAEDQTGDDASATTSNETQTVTITQDPPEKTYTQKQKDADEAKLRRRYDREIKQLKQQMDEQSKALEEIRNAPAPQPQPESSPEPGDLAGRMELMEKRFERERSEYKQKLEAAEALREAERKKRLDTEKDRLLQDAISEAGVEAKNRLLAERFFRPQIVWDDLDETWVFRTKGGNLVPISDGVSEELPDNLKPSRLKHGGAGSGTGMPASRARAQKELEQEVAKLAELKKNAIGSGARGESMAKFRRQKEKVESLRKALANKK